MTFCGRENARKGLVDFDIPSCFRPSRSPGVDAGLTEYTARWRRGNYAKPRSNEPVVGQGKGLERNGEDWLEEWTE